ncbi:hypothetical protein Dehly_0145 [Dehalogenimonas lykanthroporepellens BL-DC-9]|nr:hypothetical protein Dehly_0145 [Dehalogenimonas lykanthroporepellens BL-DC-9]
MIEVDCNLIRDLLPLLIPIIIIDLALLTVALRDLLRRQKVKGESKVVWALIIIFINLVGPIVYLVWGRHGDNEEGPNDSGYQN